MFNIISFKSFLFLEVITMINFSLCKTNFSGIFFQGHMIELCPPNPYQNMCWSPNPQNLRMGLFLEIGIEDVIG